MRHGRAGTVGRIWLCTLALPLLPHDSDASMLRVEERRETDSVTFEYSIDPDAVPAAPRFIVAYHDPSLERERVATLERRVYRGMPELRVVEVRAGFSAAQALHELARDPNVASVERDQPVELFETFPDDPLWIEQWYLQKIAAPLAWDRQTSAEDVVVAVIDTGADVQHPDLEPNIWVAPDGSRGYNCITGQPDGTDLVGHGTQVSGLIGASANDDGDPTNDLGIAGVDWSVKILPMKFVGPSGQAHVSDAIACFEKITELLDQGVNVRVTNSSWGVSEPSIALRKVMRETARRGVMHVVAAGNAARDIDLVPTYPASYKVLPGMVSVASSGITDQPSLFSNYGLASVDLAAPGEYILSTVPTGGCPACASGAFGYESGTSMAAPLVAGVAASVLQTHPQWNPQQVRDLLLSRQQSVPVAMASTSGGRVDFGSVRRTVDAMNFPPSTNKPPQIYGKTVNVILGEDDQAELSYLVGDADDPTQDLTQSVQRASLSGGGTLAVLGWMVDQRVPDPADGSPIVLDGFRSSRHLAVPFAISLTDGRGGAALHGFHATILPSESSAAGSAPSAALVASPLSGPVGTVVTFGIAASDPDGGNPAWSYACHGPAGGFTQFTPGSSSYSRSFGSAGRYRCRAQLVDDELNLTTTDSVLISIGAETNEPPLAKLSANRLVGTPPFEVQLDASESSDVDGSIGTYFFGCRTNELAAASNQPFAGCTFDTPGLHVVRVTVQDERFSTDTIEIPISVLPREHVAPVVTLRPPPPRPPPSNTVDLSVEVDDNVGVDRVEYFLEGQTSPFATRRDVPYAATLDTAALLDGAHAVRAVAVDFSGNRGYSAWVDILVQNAN